MLYNVSIYLGRKTRALLWRRSADRAASLLLLSFLCLFFIFLYSI